MRLSLKPRKKGYGKLNWAFVLLSLSYGFILATNQPWGANGFIVIFSIAFFLIFMSRWVLGIRGHTPIFLLYALPAFFIFATQYLVTLDPLILWNGMYYTFSPDFGLGLFNNGLELYWPLVQMTGIAVMLSSVYLIFKKKKFAEGVPPRFSMGRGMVARLQVFVGLMLAMTSVWLFFEFRYQSLWVLQQVPPAELLEGILIATYHFIAALKCLLLIGLGISSVLILGGLKELKNEHNTN